MTVREDQAKATGQDIRTVNPVPSNIKGGISSLEEKSLGAIHKAGSAPIQGVLKYAERPTRKGLYFVDNWMGHLSIFAGYAAAGANVVLFQLGGGGVAGRTLLEGSPSVVAPFLWASANPNTYATAERPRFLSIRKPASITGEKDAGFSESALNVAESRCLRPVALDRLFDLHSHEDQGRPGNAEQ